MNLTDLDTDLKAIDEHFRYVNYGGCACVASMLAKALRHQFPIMRITSCNNRTDSKQNIDELRVEAGDNMTKDFWYENGIQFAHVWVEIFTDGNWYVLDSTGLSTTKEMYRKWGIPAKGSFSIDEVTSLSEELTWNTEFDRSQLPAMQSYIERTFH